MSYAPISPSASRLRSRQVRVPTAVALLTSLLLGGAFVVVDRLKSPAEPEIRPLTDAQARQQVMGPAREFVDIGGLRAAAGTYILASCQGSDEPPYQGSAYLSFDVPTQAETPGYFRGIAAAMRDRGWSEGLAPNRHPGGKILARDGVRAVIYRNPDVPGRGVVEISGECRTVSDHRSDTTGFVDITAELGG